MLEDRAMDAKQAIRLAIAQADLVVDSYLTDLPGEHLFRRPAPGCNHLNWQLGHLVLSERRHMEIVQPGAMPPLPLGFECRYSKETASGNDPGQFCTKEELLAARGAQRAGTLALLEQLDAGDLARPSGVPYAPTVADLFLLQATHWLMHAGQWAVVRRQLGKPPLF
jgi:uncharacterized damage-inducible protein DinB